MEERVRGPTTPYPVDSGVPDETTACAACQACTAVCVPGPKYPSVAPENTPASERNDWRAETSVPLVPSESGRLSAGQMPLLEVGCVAAFEAPEIPLLDATISASSRAWSDCAWEKSAWIC
jgi:hypothetical protein